MEFHQNSTVIPDVYLWNASGIPLEYCFKIPAFFLEGVQVKAGNTSENVLNEIKQIIYSMYQAKEITEKVYKNIMNSTEM